MKQALKLIGLIALTLILGSCSSDRLDGDWDDNIKLSTRAVNFNKNKNTTTITTKGEWWRITGVSVNGKVFSSQDQDIDLTKDSYIFQSDCFTIEKKDKTTINIEVDENNTGAERKIVVYLTAGNYSDYIAVTQEGE